MKYAKNTKSMQYESQHDLLAILTHNPQFVA